jgi:hypothetical protein
MRLQAAGERLAVDRNFLAQKLALHKTYPNVTFSDSITIDGPLGSLRDGEII